MLMFLSPTPLLQNPKPCVAYVASLEHEARVSHLHIVLAVDRYYADARRLWLWEERTQSTNAGLPTEAPPRGRFVHEPPWYRYIGGGRSFESIVLRVGDARFGRNTLTLPSGEVLPLFELYPGRRLVLRVQ